MLQFIEGTDEAFAALETGCGNQCLRFRNQPMPPGCSPDNATIGFELNLESGQALLLVDRVLPSPLTDSSVASWMTEGRRTFESFPALVDWIRGPLARAYDARPQSPRSSERTDASFANGVPPQAANYTDMDEVCEALAEDSDALSINPGALQDALESRVRGQSDAVATLSRQVALHLARSNPSRPTVCFAVGPTGVGKTRTAIELVDQLNRLLPNAAFKFLRLDMNEYSEAHRVSQLLGAPQGYVGYGDGSQLLDTLRDFPRCVVLFDEIEKAHPTILRTLMNAMDAGQISSARNGSEGHSVDCRRAVFLFTSNARASQIVERVRNAGDNAEHSLDDICRQELVTGGVAPEIAGRIAHFLRYQPLRSEVRAEITALAIVEVAAEFGITLSHVSPHAVIEVMKGSRRGGFGARADLHLIDALLGDALLSAAASNPQRPGRLTGPPFVIEFDDSPPDKPDPDLSEDHGVDQF